MNRNPESPDVVVLVISDRRYAGSQTDETGPEIESWVRERGWRLRSTEVLPDEPAKVSLSIARWSDVERVALVLTTGGTGLSPRDRTPEATLAVAERVVPGIPEWIRASTGADNRFAYLSRGVAVIRERTLVINLPGSLRAVREYLAHLGKILPHALSQLVETPGTPAADAHPDPPGAPPEPL